MSRKTARVIRFPNKSLQPTKPIKVPPTFYDNDERCHGCGADLSTAGVTNNGCRLCAPFLYPLSMS